MDLSILEAAAAEVANMEEEGLSRVSSLVRKQMTLEQRVADIEEELVRVKNDLRLVQEEELPSALAEHGLKSLQMEDGSVVNVDPFYSASIPKDRTVEALGWLRDNGFGDLVKNTVSASFGRGLDDKAQALLEDLERRGMDVSQKQWVEPMTLKAFAKEQIEKGSALPSDLFGVYVGQKARVRKGKK